MIEKSRGDVRRKLEPPFKGPMKSLRCCGCKPSGPPAELMERMISYTDGEWLVGGKSGKTESVGGIECSCRRAVSVA